MCVCVCVCYQYIIKGLVFPIYIIIQMGAK